MSGKALSARDHPVACFLAITYALSWPLFVLVLWVLPDSMLLQGSLGAIAVFAPALASMIVSGQERPEGVPGRPGQALASFLGTWLVAWIAAVLVTRGASGSSIHPGRVAFAGLVSVLPAFMVSRAFSSVRGIREHFRTLLLPRGNPLWYLFALLAVPAVQLAGFGITVLIEGGSGPVSRQGLSFDPLMALPPFLYGFLFAGGINEESGWRGFALPRLQSRYCPLCAGLVVWLFWALWHLPMDLASGDPRGEILLNRLYYNVVWSILFMWVFNRTRGSILAPALFHASMNVMGAMLPRTDAAAVLFGLLAASAISIDRMWRRLPPGHAAARGGRTG
ncbi:CPBP family intramembrane metalloprotease [Candidatus Fermentibacterales bacterium]|nr:CPBP family intramembrane metalloprotease [Candidatus Fermentibacterales bacterium]